MQLAAAGAYRTQASGRTPAFIASGRTPAFMASGRTPALRASGRTPVFRASGRSPAFSMSISKFMLHFPSKMIGKKICPHAQPHNHYESLQ
ncbi:hypothetical protein FEZ61_07055 [Pseudomonas sp. MS15a(2019)]|nr:hypothetical protein [Pseudomonas sp. MS15a(2019)]